MQAKPAGGVKGFLRSTPGRIALILLTIGAVLASFVYVSTLLAIPVMLVVGLALPVYAGLKRPRYLALAGLVVLLAVAPIATVVFSQEILLPPSAASSATVAPDGSGGAVLAHATLSPFVGSTSTTFTWNVSLYPKFLDAKYNATNWSNDSVKLFISTCPGAVGQNVSYCSSGYPLIVVQYNFTAKPTNGQLVTLQYKVGTSGIWSWQMGLALENASDPSHSTLITLVGDPTYDGIEGPIVGGFATVYGALIGAIYLDEFIYVGIPFYFVLLMYMWFKSREARRRQAVRRAAKEMAASTGAAPAAGGTPPAGGGSTPASGGPASGPPAVGPNEVACPSCGAVVYPNEAKCWKCGAALSSGPAGPPLPSGGTPPQG